MLTCTIARFMQLLERSKKYMYPPQDTRCKTMCLSNQNSNNACRTYDDYTSQRFNRCRIETELLNLFDEAEDSLIACDDGEERRGKLNDAYKGYISGSNRSNDLTSNGRSCNGEVDVRPFGYSNEDGFSIIVEEDCHQDKHNALNDDLFDDGWYDDDLFDSFNFSVDLDYTDCDQTVMTNSSQISYDDDSTATTSSTEFFLNSNKQELQDEGLSIADDDCDNYFTQKGGRLQRGFSLSSVYSGIDDEDENESQFVIVNSKGSSRFTTDSPRIFELREKKRLMERYHEKKYSRFPALIEVDISSSVL